MFRRSSKVQSPQIEVCFEGQVGFKVRKSRLFRRSKVRESRFCFEGQVGFKVRKSRFCFEGQVQGPSLASEDDFWNSKLRLRSPQNHYHGQDLPPMIKIDDLLAFARNSCFCPQAIQNCLLRHSNWPASRVPFFEQIRRFLHSLREDE